MNTDPRYLVVPEQITNDPKAIELVSAWFYNGKVSAMTRTGTGLDHNPETWGEILAGIANNAALSAEKTVNVDRGQMLARMKASLDRQWHAMQPTKGDYYPPPAD